MVPSESSLQELSEAILTWLAPFEGIVKFRHTLLVIQRAARKSCSVLRNSLVNNVSNNNVIS